MIETYYSLRDVEKKEGEVLAEIDRLQKYMEKLKSIYKTETSMTIRAVEREIERLSKKLKELDALKKQFGGSSKSRDDKESGM